jgi:hypothetical protein
MRVNADPDDLEAFANNILGFVETVRDAQGTLDSQFAALRDSWADQKCEQFSRQLEELRGVLMRFQAATEDHVPYLRNLAARLREFLES